MLAVATPHQSDALNFQTVDSALRWAYGAQDRAVGTVISRIYFLGTPRGHGELSKSEATVQATLIIEDAERHLDERLCEYVRARFKHQHEGFPHLRLWVLAGLPTGVHYGRGVEKMILQYLGHPIGLLSLRKDLRCRTDTAIKYRNIAHERMDAIHDEAMKALRPLFHAKGWVL